MKKTKTQIYLEKKIEDCSKNSVVIYDEAGIKEKSRSLKEMLKEIERRKK